MTVDEAKERAVTMLQRYQESYDGFPEPTSMFAVAIKDHVEVFMILLAELSRLREVERRAETAEQELETVLANIGKITEPIDAHTGDSIPWWAKSPRDTSVGRWFPTLREARRYAAGLESTVPPTGDAK